MATGELDRAIYFAYPDRHWEGAATLLHLRAVVEMPGTVGRLKGREAVIAFQRAYPEP